MTYIVAPKLGNYNRELALEEINLTFVILTLIFH